MYKAIRCLIVNAGSETKVMPVRAWSFWCGNVVPLLPPSLEHASNESRSVDAPEREMLTGRLARIESWVLLASVA